MGQRIKPVRNFFTGNTEYEFESKSDQQTREGLEGLAGLVMIAGLAIYAAFHVLRFTWQGLCFLAEVVIEKRDQRSARLMGPTTDGPEPAKPAASTSKILVCSGVAVVLVLVLVAAFAPVRNTMSTASAEASSVAPQPPHEVSGIRQAPRVQQAPTMEASAAAVQEAPASATAPIAQADPAPVPAPIENALPVDSAVATPAVAAIKASFDCGNAYTPVEKLICSDAALAQSDVALADTYRAALGRVGSPERLKADRRKWLRAKRDACDDARCLLATYAERKQVLDALLGMDS